MEMSFLHLILMTKPEYIVDGILLTKRKSCGEGMNRSEDEVVTFDKVKATPDKPE